MFSVKKSSMLIVAALLRLLVMMVCLARKGASSSYFTQKRGLRSLSPPHSSTQMGQRASALVWNVDVAWS